MYFPYLRAKQYELISLREIASNNSTSAIAKEYLSPIIEPIKASSTLSSTLCVLSENDVNFNVIINPQHGSMNTDETYQNIENLGVKNFQWTIIIDDKLASSQFQELIALTKESKSSNKISIVHFGTHEDIDRIKALSEPQTSFNIIYSRNNRYRRNFDSLTLVRLDDFFPRQDRNADYANLDDSVFSEEHLFYSDDGYRGFGDFLTIGDNYSEGGFQPYAVAIHFSYFDKNNKIRIKHFVSDSNFDYSDVPGKFLEALEKLHQWVVENNPQQTLALTEFNKLYEAKRYPGLGSVKKLSIMNHIELVISYLSISK